MGQDPIEPKNCKQKKKKKKKKVAVRAGPRAYAVRTRASHFGVRLLCGPARSAPLKIGPSRTGLNGPGWPAYPPLVMAVEELLVITILALFQISSQARYNGVWGF